uniref:Secreted protein n=1 Tax=Caenorhabditis tropicalis TaxID=1561998 RepID=A0A1I7TA72_9PELO
MHHIICIHLWWWWWQRVLLIYKPFFSRPPIHAHSISQTALSVTLFILKLVAKLSFHELYAQKPIVTPQKLTEKKLVPRSEKCNK